MSIEFPDDIIVEILTWLPAKALVRFRCVCKPWRALFSDSSFVQKHLSRSGRRKLLLGLGHDDHVVSVLSFKEIDVAVTTKCHDLYFHYVYGCSNGILCLQEENYEGIILLNPCTREVNLIPERYAVGSEEPCVNDYMFLAGFGYDSTVEDYKIIRGTRSLKHFDRYVYEGVTFQVFTLKTGSWRTIPFKCLNIHDLFFSVHQGTLFKETLYWITHGLCNDGNTLWSFGLAEEKFKIVAEFPTPTEGLSSACSLMTDGNSVFLQHETSIWIVKAFEGGEASWIKVMDICLEVFPNQKLAFGCRPSIYPYMAVGIFDNGDVLLCNTRSLGLFTPEKKMFREVSSTWTRHLWWYGAHVETLVSPMTISLTQVCSTNVVFESYL